MRSDIAASLFFFRAELISRISLLSLGILRKDLNKNVLINTSNVCSTPGERKKAKRACPTLLMNLK